MKKLLFLSTLMTMFCHISFAQKAGKLAPTYVSATAKVDKYYTEEELQKLGKLELTQIYMLRIATLTEVMPYVALHPRPGATLTEMGIPSKAEQLDHVEKANKNKSLYLNAVKDTLDDIVPYADKTNIIRSILFFEDVIKKTEEFETNLK
jgi:uncharacterized membrane protein